MRTYADVCGRMLTYADSQVSMALGRAGGHVLLMGPGGGGKKTVGMLTARLLGYKVCELQVAKPLCSRAASV
jgi:hypothetical protein